MNLSNLQKLQSINPATFIKAIGEVNPTKAFNSLTALYFNESALTEAFEDGIILAPHMLESLEINTKLEAERNISIIEYSFIQAKQTKGLNNQLFSSNKRLISTARAAQSDNERLINTNKCIASLLDDALAEIHQLEKSLRKQNKIPF